MREAFQERMRAEYVRLSWRRKGNREWLRVSGTECDYITLRRPYHYDDRMVNREGQSWLSFYGNRLLKYEEDQECEWKHSWQKFDQAARVLDTASRARGWEIDRALQTPINLHEIWDHGGFTAETFVRLKVAFGLLTSGRAVEDSNGRIDHRTGLYEEVTTTVARSGFDETKDAELAKIVAVETERTRITVSVHTYDGGRARVQLSRENKEDNGEWKFKKMGRMDLYTEAARVCAAITKLGLEMKERGIQ